MNVQEELLQTKIDPALTDETLSEIVSRALKNGGHGAGGPSAVRVLGYRVLTGGCWNRVVAVESEGLPEVVLKISPHDEDSDIVREYQVLSRFAELSDFPVPKPLYLDGGRVAAPGNEDTAPGSLLPGTTLAMTKIPGQVMHRAFGRLSTAGRQSILDQLTEDVIRLHKTKSRGFGGVEIAESERLLSWPAFWLPRLQEVVRTVRDADVLPEAAFRRAENLWPFLEELLEIGEESTLTHYDIWAGNVMIDIGAVASGPRITGYIDIPGNWADYAWEISFMQVFGLADEQFLRRYDEAHGLDDTFELRLRAYQLRTFMKHVMMYPTEGYYRQGTEMCLKTLEQAAG